MLSLKNWRSQTEELKAAGVELPSYDVDALKAAGKKQPVWIHFGGGNLYRAFHAEIAQRLANKGLLDRGIVVAETFSPFTIDNIYKPYGCDSLEVVMKSDGTLEERVLASTADGVFANSQRPEDFERTKAYFRSPELQLVTFTITEKGYGLRNAAGEFFPFVAKELLDGPKAAASTMGIVTELLPERSPLPRRRAHGCQGLARQRPCVAGVR